MSICLKSTMPKMKPCLSKSANQSRDIVMHIAKYEGVSRFPGEDLHPILPIIAQTRQLSSLPFGVLETWVDHRFDGLKPIDILGPRLHAIILDTVRRRLAKCRFADGGRRACK